jgi:hypothetical protein
MPAAEQLLQDAAWLRCLATTFANDSDDADVFQESWIAASYSLAVGALPRRAPGGVRGL